MQRSGFLLAPVICPGSLRKKCGMGFSDYLTKPVWKRACELLGDIKYKSYDVAYYIGYDNQKNFSKGI